MNADEQGKKERGWNLVPYQFKKGFSGNPGGRPEGRKSMKTWAKEYLEGLDEEERIAFINSQHGGLIWQMAEGGPATKIEATVTQTQFSPEEIEAAKQIIVKRLSTDASRTTGEGK